MSPASAPAPKAKPVPPQGAQKRGAPAASNIDVMDEKTALLRFSRLRKVVTAQTWVMAGLVAFLTVLLPFAQPFYIYYARDPNNHIMQMAALDVPNMTNRAVLSWATTSITEIMTMGFGDMDMRLPQQRVRFTKPGWDAYTKAFVEQKIGQTFKQSQLVLTTVPSNTPVIVAQGVNLDRVYQWVVQMPVIMTYATNNNMMKRERAIVSLTIVRVPADESSSGIAIQSWHLG